MAQVLLLDNYDSFTYNLVHYFEDCGAEVRVMRNDESSIQLSNFDALVVSPGPGLPEDAGNLMGLLRDAEGRIPVLGICLGMQAMALHLGGKMYNQEVVMHGVQQEVSFLKSDLFLSVPSEAPVGLYHSWAVEETGDFTINARSENGVVMGIERADLEWYGLQFHPESVMTPNGKQIIANFLKILEG